MAVNEAQMTISFGAALAILVRQHSTPDIETNGPDTDGRLTELAETWQLLANSPDRIQEILDAFPEASCHEETCKLADNYDFFMAYFLGGLLNNMRENTCHRLFIHLNDCYRCFGVFSDVMRDYCRGVDNGQ